jgi:hypothetical protein
MTSGLNRRVQDFEPLQYAVAKALIASAFEATERKPLDQILFSQGSK